VPHRRKPPLLPRGILIAAIRDDRKNKARIAKVGANNETTP